jgi:diguanylate cyclase (GGDEF)-like protein
MLLSKIFQEDRKLIAAKLMIFFSLIFMFFFTIYTYFYNIKLFYIDGTIFLLLVCIYFIFLKNIYLISYIIAFVMTSGILFLIFTYKGKEGITVWLFCLILYYFFAFGHKIGTIVSFIVLAIAFVLMYNWIGTSFSREFYIRNVVACIAIFLISSSYEYAINKTIDKLNYTKKMLEDLVKIDGLTTLYNRRYFDEIFPKRIKMHNRKDDFLVFAIIDIDYFKSYNDTYGHQSGDEVLKVLSLSFKESMKREDDYAFRLGGEEFGLLFTINQEEQGIKIVDSIRKRIENLKIEHTGNIVSKFVTVSIGVYISKYNNKCTYESVYKICDEALYIAKEQGRNRVHLV